jgi:hypothetical protein
MTLDNYEAATADPGQTRADEIAAHNERMRLLRPRGDAQRDRLVAARLQVRQTQEEK